VSIHKANGNSRLSNTSTSHNDKVVRARRPSVIVFSTAVGAKVLWETNVRNAIVKTIMKQMNGSSWIHVQWWILGVGKTNRRRKTAIFENARSCPGSCVDT
jgi:hypothetical protein